MKITNIKFIPPILIALLLSVSIVHAQFMPPNAFLGYVIVNGQPAPDGTTIVAKIDGVQVASTTTSGGKYGYPLGVFMVYDPNNDRIGKEIKFFVNGVDTGKNYSFNNGDIIMINFSVTITNPPVNPPSNPPSNPPVNPPSNNTTNQTTPQTCQERWLCSDWSACTNGVQTRTCNDANSCGTNNNEPMAAQPCPAENKTEEGPGPEASTLPTITGFFALLSNPVYLIIILLLIVAVILIILGIKLSSHKIKKKR